jgi:hypothetical protein
MPKICSSEGCYNNVWGKGYCKFHQYLRTDKKKKTINPISDKRLNELALYRPIRDKYLNENTSCEVRECDNKSTHILTIIITLWLFAMNVIPKRYTKTLLGLERMAISFDHVFFKFLYVLIL